MCLYRFSLFLYYICKARLWFYSFFFLMWLQGYLPVEASVLDVEVWGLGGEATRRQQDVYKKRENIFSEQRRKVLPPAKLNHSLCMSLPKCAAMPMVFPIFSVSGWSQNLWQLGRLSRENDDGYDLWSKQGSPGRSLNLILRQKYRLLMFSGCLYRYGHENGEYWLPCGNVEKSVHIFACPFVGHTWHVIEVV